jgi:SAM-dependent methyltransferase
MDMHAMTFSDNQFDLVYSAHSLEHAYEPTQVAQEINRVARPGAIIAVTVPIHFEPRGSDLVDFGDVKNLLDLFKPHVTEALWFEEHPPHSPLNDDGNTIVRAVFAVKTMSEESQD